jgi:hypothetical protein
VKSDPTDTGGLFVGRRPGTRPVKYRELPQRGSDARRRFDDALAAAILVLMTVVGRIFAVSAAIGAVVFTIWLLVFAGLGPTIAPH